jgi:lipopolysaccharide/colanic/teichoic acid biosynthesis glycosyltransferase
MSLNRGDLVDRSGSDEPADQQDVQRWEVAIEGVGHSAVDGVSAWPASHEYRGPDRTAYSRFGKRSLDVACSAAFLLAIGIWLFPMISAAIRLDSRGPALYRQVRVGRDGELFTCLKFRSMTHAPESAFRQAQRNDPRVTRVGAWLRRTNLDELPQFINVLMGEMSMVGPRPHVPDLDHVFAEQIGDYKRRQSVRPGVTGLAQISGYRGEPAAFGICAIVSATTSGTSTTLAWGRISKSSSAPSSPC